MFFLKRKYLQNLSLCLALLLMLSSCSPLISAYDQYSYTQTTSLKVDAINLMVDATEDYSKHETEVKTLTTNIQKILEYEKHRPKNEITTSQWKILNDTSGNLLGGFLKEWKVKHMLKPAYIPLKQEQVSKAFDQIIELEAKKIHR